MFFFFKQKTAYEMRISDWSSDVCSSDLSGDHGDVADGRFTFRSRIDDVLRLGGFLVNPREIEEFLQDLPGVESAQVVAVAHEGRSVPFAFLIAAPGATLAETEILAACRASLRSEEHTSELQSLMRISYAVFCL